MENPAPTLQTFDEILASITPDQKEQLYLQLLAESARGDNVQSVCDFGELVYGVVAAKHHRAWISHILNNLRTGIVAPPESAKTTWITKITVAWWIGKYPLLTNGICSASDKAAEKMAAAIADTIEYNPRWKLVFPDVRPDKARGWSSTGYHVFDAKYGVDEQGKPAGEWARLRYGTLDASLMAAGVGSSAWNGVRISGIFAFDDAHDRRSKTQQATNDDTVGFFNDTALPRATRDARVVVVQTRWNKKDVIAKIKTLNHFKVFEHPAIIQTDNGPASYWPEQWPLERLREREIEVTPIVFDLVYQGNDLALEGTVLKTEWLHAFPFLDFRKEWNRYFGVDFAQKMQDIVTKNDDPDDFVLSVMADAGPRLVVEDVFAEVLYMGDAEELFFSKAGIYRPKNSGVETNGAAAKTYYLNLLKRMRRLGLNYVITPVTRTSDKGSYYAAMAPYFSSGQVLVSDAQTPGLEKFRAQWAAFPKGHDDVLDGVYNCWHITSFLLPSESVPAHQARIEQARHAVSPAQLINQAYR